MRSKLKYLSFLFCTTFLLTEGAARIAFPRYAGSATYLAELAFPRLVNSFLVPRADDSEYGELGFTLTPNQTTTFSTAEYTYTVTTNSLGFRSKELRPRAVAEYRVLLLGDSMVFGVGLDEDLLLPAQLEALTSQQNGTPRLSVHNYALSGLNTVQEILVAKRHAAVVDPDHLILGLFVGNDVIPNALSYVDESGRYALDVGMSHTIKGYLKDAHWPFLHSTALRIIALYAHVPRIRYQISRKPEVIRRTYMLLSDLQLLADDLSTELTVVILYPRDGIAGGLLEAWSGSRDVGRLIRDYCVGNGIDVVDSIEFMSGREDRRHYYFEDDGHMNGEGMRVLAEGIWERVLKTQSAPQKVDH